ncbi:MAG: hypothetical protein QOE59_3474 [Actinomycetota bacterium]|jgi:hypothetical protein|nr:hypothetical protein [Actinomycetota bacterium]
MDRDEILRQGKQTASDLRDTVSQKVSENEDTIKGTLGKAARWVDEKTGGKYAEHIGKVEAKVGEGIGWVASQGPATPASGEPGAPGAAAGDPAPGAGAPGSTPPGPIHPDAGTPGAPPHAPHAAGAPGSTPPGPIAPDAQTPHTPTEPDADAPRPPQV